MKRGLLLALFVASLYGIWAIWTWSGQSFFIGAGIATPEFVSHHSDHSPASFYLGKAVRLAGENPAMILLGFPALILTVAAIGTTQRKATP